MHNAREHAAAVQVHLTHRQGYGERRPIPALPAHLPSDADDMRLAGLAIPCQVGIVFLPVGGRREHPDVLPKYFARGVPKEALGSRVE